MKRFLGTGLAVLLLLVVTSAIAREIRYSQCAAIINPGGTISGRATGDNDGSDNGR